MINIVIPMAGEGSRFKDAGFNKPKPFIDVNGLTMIERVIENLICAGARFYLIGRKEHLELEKELVKQIELKYNATFIEIDKLTEGTACTVLYARKFINNESPLLIANSDQLVAFSVSEYISDCFNRNLDGSILCFHDQHLNPKWSFARINEKGMVIEVREKEPISHHATVGLYLFRTGNLFIDSAIDMIVHNDRVKNEFYTCPVYNYAIASGSQIGIYAIAAEKMHGLGTPEDLAKYLEMI